MASCFSYPFQQVALSCFFKIDSLPQTPNHLLIFNIKQYQTHATNSIEPFHILILCSKVICLHTIIHTHIHHPTNTHKSSSSYDPQISHLLLDFLRSCKTRLAFFFVRSSDLATRLSGEHEGPYVAK